MQVLGYLLKLPEGMTSLPLPWWHRSVLGFLHRTPVHVVLLKSNNRPVGELVVTVLDPGHWDKMKILEGVHTDSPGVIKKVFESVLPLNIAIAETVTIEADGKHHVCLFLESAENKDVKKDVILNKLRKKGFKSFRLAPYMTTSPKILWQDVTQVDHGWLHGIEWKKQILDKFPNTYQSVDLDRCVISADTKKRILRFVFPKKGALFVKIEHSDIPGALKAMTECFVDCKLNVLSAILSRGGAKQQNAVLHAVCEPSQDKIKGNLNEILDNRLKKLHYKFRASWVINSGEDATHMIYPRHPDEHIARLPSTLLSSVREHQRTLARGKVPIFVSRRFMSGERFNKIIDRIRKVLREFDCIPVEAEPESGQFYTTPVQVFSKMWASKAGIVLIAGGDGDSFSMNLVHEAGFLQGQGKEVLILVEEGSGEEMVKWSNGLGLVAPRFPIDDRAFNPDDPESLDWQLKKWVYKVKKKIDGEYL